MSIETQLREALSARADELGGLAGDPYERVSGAIAVSRRRRRTAALAGVAAVAVVAVAIPSCSGELGRDTHHPRHEDHPGSICRARATRAGPRWRPGRPGGRSPRRPRSSPRRTNGWPRATRTTSCTPARWPAAGSSLPGRCPRRPTPAPRAAPPRGRPQRRSGRGPLSPAWRKAPRPPRTSRWPGWASRPPTRALTLVLTLSHDQRHGRGVGVREGQRRRFGDPDPVAAVRAHRRGGRHQPVERPDLPHPGAASGGYDGQATGLVDGDGPPVTQTGDLPAACGSDFDERYVAATTAGVAQQLGRATARHGQHLGRLLRTGRPRGRRCRWRHRRRRGQAATQSSSRQPGGRRGPAQRASLVHGHRTDGSWRRRATHAPRRRRPARRARSASRSRSSSTGLDRRGQPQLFQVFAPGRPRPRWFAATSPDLILLNSTKTPVTGSSATFSARRHRDERARARVADLRRVGRPHRLLAAGPPQRSTTPSTTQP